ncbi:MAG TPA: patatin-like phospholipase family protein [Bryobacteraceae bacterium]|nr:patatin-like phospholipase family protein [Bryobacteraceae bacterium]
MDSDNTKSALVLSGGGAFGAYEVGVIRALCGRGSLDAEVFAGTSVGNFNAAILAMNKGGACASAELLQEIWLNRIADSGDGRGNGVYRIRGHIENYFDHRIPGSPLEQLKRLAGDLTAFGGYTARTVGHFLASTGRLSHRLAGLIDLSVLLDTDPFARLIQDTIEPHVLRESAKWLTVTATNWGTGEPRNFHVRHLNNALTWQAVRASAAIPGLFPPVSIEGEIYIDGGVVMNTPIKPAIDAGASEIHVISLDPCVPDLGKAYAGATWDVMNRVVTAMVAENIAEDIETARWINEGLEVLERMESDEADFDTAAGKRFIRAARTIRRRLEKEGELPRKLTIHRYYPKKPLGGFLGLLNFERQAIATMIEQGYADACEHDCTANGCVIPKNGPASRPPDTPHLAQVLQSNQA